jgi:hypothetical protein
MPETAMRAPLRLVLTLTPLAACLPPPLTDCSDDGCLATSQADTSSASSPTTSGPPIHTVTGDDAGATGASSTDEPASTDTSSDPQGTTTNVVNEKPEIYGFKLSKNKMFAPGEVELLLDASDDVVEVDVWYGDVLLATVPVDAFPYRFDVTSQSVCDGVAELHGDRARRGRADGHAARGAVLSAARARERGLHPRPSRRIDEQQGPPSRRWPMAP